MINNAFDFIPLTLNHTGRYFAVIFFSALSAVVFMAIFKKVSNQEGIKLEKAKIVGNLFQMRLYKDDLLLVLSSFLNIIKHNLLYLRYLLVPLIAVTIPLMIITVQVNQRCGYSPLKNGDEFIVTVDLNNSRALDSIECITTSGIELLTPVMRVYENRKAFWRAKIRENTETDETVSFHAKGRKIGFRTIVTNEPKKRFTSRTTRLKSIEALFYNAEGFLPENSPIKSVTINYPRAKYSFFWINMDAILLYFILTLLLALMIKPFFKMVI